ncbi:MAG: hypothetical protein SGJ27_12820 [Candidatus Melainabacteria bacterium]|nr:hypothetical protein [Candidatus Melainabacteria bacterium]
MIRKSLVLLFVFLWASSSLTAAAQPTAQGEKDGALLKDKAPLEADSSVELSVFKNDSITMKYPSGWQLISDVPKPRVLHVKTMGGRVNASLTVQDLPAGTTLQQYRDATTRDIESEAKELSPKKLVEEKSLLGNVDAWKLIYSINVPKTEPPVSAKQTLYISVKNNRGYLLCCTAFDLLPGKFDSVFRLMAESLTVSAPEAADTDPTSAL